MVLRVILKYLRINPYATLGTYAAIFSDTRVTGVGLGRLAIRDLQWEQTPTG